MKLRTSALSLIAGAPLAFAAFQAEAIQIVGHSDGSFNDLSSCDNSGSNANCRIVSTINGTATQVQWGSTAYDGDDFNNASKLTAVDVNINVNTDANDVILAQLSWFNSATTYDEQLLDFSVDWMLKLDFSKPLGSVDSYAEEEFDLRILNPVNPTGDTMMGFSLTSLQGLELNLKDVTITDMKYCINGFGPSSCFTSGTWYNKEYSTSNLYITADFKARTQSVPEPGTLALLSLGLLGVGAAARRRRA